MNNDRDKIIQLVKFRGPVLPSHISKEIGTNILFASAILSELVDSRKLKLSNVKVGGSPLYYAEGQEYKLQNYSRHLHEKEQKAYALLQAKKVLRDISLEPVIRAALRQIKDFAVPLDVNYDGAVQLFWKWYLTPNSEAESLIKKDLGIEEAQPQHLPPQPAPKLPEQPSVAQQEVPPPMPEIKKEKFIDSGEPNDVFYRRLRKFCDDNGIRISGIKLVKKNAEIDLVLEIPSAVGALTYYCKAKNKKKCNEGDLSAAYVVGQNRKLPVVFITTGELTKKAKEMLAEFKHMHVKGI